MCEYGSSGWFRVNTACVGGLVDAGIEVDNDVDGRDKDFGRDQDND